MASNVLQRMLRELCGSLGWTYGVFWRLRKRLVPRSTSRVGRMRLSPDGDDWVLTWEDGYLSNVAQVAESCQSIESIVQGSVDYGLLQAAYSRLSYQIYNYGEGLIGLAVSSQSPEWVHKEGNGSGSFHFRFNTLPTGWNCHFAAGIKTITIIPVPGGVIQLGSIHYVPEDPQLANDLRRRFHLLQKIPGIFSSDYHHPHSYPPTPSPLDMGPSLHFPSAPQSGSASVLHSQGFERRLMRNESSDSSAASESVRFAASPAVSCLASPNQRMTAGGVPRGRTPAQRPALTPFHPTEEEQELASLQFKFLSVTGAQTAAALNKAPKRAPQMGPRLSLSPPQGGLKRPHHSRSVSMPLFSTPSFRQPGVGGNPQVPGGVSSLVSQLRSAMWRRENAAQQADEQEPQHLVQQRQPVASRRVNGGASDELRMRVLPPLEQGVEPLTSGGCSPEAELLDQLKLLEEKRRLGVLSEEIVELLLTRLETKAQRLGLVCSADESLLSTERVNSQAEVEEAQLETEAQSGTEEGIHQTVSEDLETYLDGFDLGVDLPSPSSPPAKRVNLEGFREDYFGTSSNRTSIRPTLMEQIDELRRIVPGSHDSNLASLLQRTVDFISHQSKQEDGSSDLASIVVNEGVSDFRPSNRNQFDGSLHALV